MLAFLDHLSPCIDVLYLIIVDKKWTFLDHLPTSSCKRSLWTPPYLWSKQNIVHYNIFMLYQINYQIIYGCFKFSLIKTTTESAMQWRKLASLPSLLTVDSGWHYEYKLPSISQWGQIIFEFAFAFDLQNTYIFVNCLLHFLYFLNWNNRKYLMKRF